MLRATSSVCNENGEHKKNIFSASCLRFRSRFWNVSLDASHRGRFSDLTLGGKVSWWRRRSNLRREKLV